jgi:hypothetical protein
MQTVKNIIGGGGVQTGEMPDGFLTDVRLRRISSFGFIFSFFTCL